MELFDHTIFINDTGMSDFHSNQTIELGELIEANIFNWERVNWKNAAYSETQYNELCNAFEIRFYTREISITPVALWMRRLQYELVYNLMPKYKPLYKQLEDYDPLQTGGEYFKERKINSDFPETLLSQNEDYASTGHDIERESIGRGNLTDDYLNYAQNFQTINVMILDELEKTLFTSLYTTNVNGW